jgi:hypothetical protein
MARRRSSRSTRRCTTRGARSVARLLREAFGSGEIVSCLLLGGAQARAMQHYLNRADDLRDIRLQTIPGVPRVSPNDLQQARQHQRGRPFCRPQLTLSVA